MNCAGPLVNCIGPLVNCVLYWDDIALCVLCRAASELCVLCKAAIELRVLCREGRSSVSSSDGDTSDLGCVMTSSLHRSSDESSTPSSPPVGGAQPPSPSTLTLQLPPASAPLHYTPPTTPPVTKTPKPSGKLSFKFLYSALWFHVNPGSAVLFSRSHIKLADRVSLAVHVTPDSDVLFCHSHR